MIYTFIDPQGNEYSSSIPYGGYSYEALQSMAENGFTLKIDGKEAKFPSRVRIFNRYSGCVTTFENVKQVIESWGAFRIRFKNGKSSCEYRTSEFLWWYV